jgi:adenine phosphoribosyltransferase
MPALDQNIDVAKRLRAAVRDIPDFPKAGITFKDITPILADAPLFAAATEAMAAPWARDGVTHVAAIESRGFILGAPVAHALDAGFIPIRKRGKLPFQTQGVDYALEYGTDRVEAHVDACSADSRVLVVDDVLATGGTAAATCALLEALGATVVGCSFLLAIAPLGGTKRLDGRSVQTLLTF